MYVQQHKRGAFTAFLYRQRAADDDFGGIDGHLVDMRSFIVLCMLVFFLSI
jgi:hypothetical protein